MIKEQTFYIVLGSPKLSSHTFEMEWFKTQRLMIGEVASLFDTRLAAEVAIRETERKRGGRNYHYMIRRAQVVTQQLVTKRKKR